MSLRLISTNLLSLSKNVSVEWRRTLASASYDLKLFAVGADKRIAAKAEQSLKSLGYKNAIVVGLINSPASDQELLSKLKEQQWDAISIGGYLNGFDTTFQPSEDNVPTDRRELLRWFNRVLNVIHEQAPKSKIILVESSEDIHPAIQRVMREGKGQA